MPGAGMVAGEMLPLLWSASFANAIVKLGRLRSPGPVALYYDPLLDIAVLTFWQRRDGGYRVVSVRALPGERLEAPEAEVPVLPSWTTAQTGLVESMARTTAARLHAFRRAHPADAGEPGRHGASFASAAADMRAVLPRLAWSASERARWTDEAKPWLRPAAASIERVLAARNLAVLTAAAPETGPALEAWYRFLLWLVPAVARFPRRQKFLLGDRIQSTALDILESLIEATYTRQRESHLARANLGIEKLRFLVRLALDLGYLDPRRYEHAARALDETGRKVGAWRKTHRARAHRCPRSITIRST